MNNKTPITLIEIVLYHLRWWPRVQWLKLRNAILRFRIYCLKRRMGL